MSRALKEACHKGVDKVARCPWPEMFTWSNSTLSLSGLPEDAQPQPISHEVPSKPAPTSRA